MGNLFAMLLPVAGTVLKAALIAAIGLLLIRLVGQFLDKALEKTKLEKAAYSLIKTLVKTVMAVLLALIVASSLTLAVSLALQNMLANVIGGFTLLYTKPFHAGDYVEIAGQSGTIQEVGIAYTRLSTVDNKFISIPNSSVVAAQIVNYSSADTRRVDVAVTASYDAPVATVEAALQAAAQVPGVLEDPAVFVSVTGYGDSAISYVVRAWCNSADYWDVHFAITHKIKEQFDANGIQMTYPHLNVHLDK